MNQTEHKHTACWMGSMVTTMLVLAALASLTACNTTKATVDSTVKFSSSTSPDSMFTGDGMVEKDQRVMLYTAVVADDLREDIARGSGEYLTSLGVLLDIPADRQARFGAVSQEQYASLFPVEAHGNREALTALRRHLAVPQSEALR